MDLASICTGGTKGECQTHFVFEMYVSKRRNCLELKWESPKSRLQRVAPCLTTMGLVKNDEIRTNKISAHTKDERFEVGYLSIMSNALRMSQPQESM